MARFDDDDDDDRPRRRRDEDDEDDEDAPRRRRRREDDDEDDGPLIRRRGGQRYANFFARLGAVLLDGLLLGIIFSALGFVVGLVVGAANPTAEQAQLIMIPFQIFAVVVQWLYYALQESGPHQATLGKRALGLKVTDLDGRPISFMRASGRFFGKTLSFAICCIGFLMAAFTERKQALHDMLAGTLVLER